MELHSEEEADEDNSNSLVKTTRESFSTLDYTTNSFVQNSNLDVKAIASEDINKVLDNNEDYESLLLSISQPILFENRIVLLLDGIVNRKTGQFWTQPLIGLHIK